MNITQAETVTATRRPTPRDESVSVGTLEGGIERVFPKGEFLYRPGEPAREIYWLREGIVQIFSLTEAGKEFVLELVPPGRFFGEHALAERLPREHFAQAWTDVRVRLYSQRELVALMRENPELSLEMTLILGRRLSEVMQRVSSLAFHSAEQRLAGVLLQLFREHGVPDGNGGIQLPMKLTQQELGSLVGVTRESINTCLRRLRDMGLIDSSNRRLLLLQPKGLASFLGP